MLHPHATLLAVGIALACVVSAQTRLHYPQPRRSDHVDTYFGDKVADPYRWMEDVDSPETRQWIEAENKLTFSYLDALPQREEVRRRLTDLFNYERYNEPLQVNGRIFYAHNTGLQNQPVFYWQDGPAGPAHVLIDPNTLAADGTAAIDGYFPDRTGSLVAYAVAQAGSDWRIFRIRDVRTGKDLPDTLHWTKSTSITWMPDGKSFYYTRFPEPKPGAALTQANENAKIYYHRLGDDQSKDTMIYQRPDHPHWDFGADVTEDGRYLIIYTAEGASGQNALSYLDLHTPGAKVTPLIERFDAAFQVIGNNGQLLYVFTNDQAPRSKVISIDLQHPAAAQWRTIIAQQPDTMETAILASGKLICSFLHDAHSAARIYALDGKPVQEIPLPGLGHATWSSYAQSDKQVFFTYSEFTRPPSIFRLDVASGKPALFRAAKLSFDPAQFETRQEFYHSTDGTRVPMFIISRTGMQRNGQNPTILYGYGGFNIAITPTFYPRVIAWLQMGGVFVLANLRGGSEYGEEWHQAGTKLHKQNVFDDFIAGAEYLIAQKVTSTPKLAIEGRSNGGLLVGAVLNQRPDLFGAALPGVGVMDMLRFQKFTVGQGWVTDYGSSDNAEEYKAIRKYSPLHNIKKGTKYPPAFIVTADHDDRVVPGHSFKYAATMQWAQSGDAPILIRIETKAGHGGGKPVSKIIGETADEYAFLARWLMPTSGAQPTSTGHQ
jgi:prolyl oligopeptidase